MNSVRYVDWDKEATKVIISSYEEWNSKIDSLNWDDYIPFEATQGVRTIRSFWLDGRWSYRYIGNHPAIYIGYEIDRHEIWYFHLADDVNENGMALSGFEACRILKEKMQETNGKKLQARFGGLNQFDKDNLWLVEALHAINKCVGPFIGNASLKSNQYYEDKVYKADVSSAYPGEGMYNLPDLRTAQLFDETIEPSEEWPIVFYLDSHHVAEYGVFDTREDQYHVLYKSFRNRARKKVLRNKNKKEYKRTFGFLEEGEQCLACKYSSFNLEEFKYFYDRKSIDEAAKAVMNLSIGTFDFVVCPDYKIIQSKNMYYGHLRALICARHNHNMIKYYDEIERKGYEVLQVQTDSIIWRGGPIESATREKEIGKLHLEIENGKAFIHGCGAYWIEDNNTHIEKHQSIRNWQEVQSLEEFKEFFAKAPVVIEHWHFNMETLKFELTEV